MPLSCGSCSACWGATLPPCSPELRELKRQAKRPQMESRPALEAQFSGVNGLAFEALPFILFAAQALQPQHHIFGVWDRPCWETKSWKYLYAAWTTRSVTAHSASPSSQGWGSHHICCIFVKLPLQFSPTLTSEKTSVVLLWPSASIPKKAGQKYPGTLKNSVSWDIFMLRQTRKWVILKLIGINGT